MATNNKTFKTRVQLKSDTEANWNLATNFTPKLGEAIVYNVDANNTKPRLKIGDGNTTVANLPFMGAESTGGVEVVRLI